MRQKRFYLRSAHLGGVSFIMKQNEPPNPVDVNLLGPDAILLEPDAITHLIQQTWPFLHVRFPSLDIVRFAKPSGVPQCHRGDCPRISDVCARGQPDVYGVYIELAVMANIDAVFDQHKKLSVYWHNKASDLHGSAGALWASMHAPDASTTAERVGLGYGFSFEAACFPVYTMLCGMALELLLKAIVVADGREPKQNSHNLADLWLDAGVPLSSDKSGLLGTLSEAIIWYGRYPVPKRPEHFNELATLQREHLYSKVPIGKTLNMLRPNGSLHWDAFNELWSLASEAYQNHC